MAEPKIKEWYNKLCGGGQYLGDCAKNFGGKVREYEHGHFNRQRKEDGGLLLLKGKGAVLI